MVAKEEQESDIPLTPLFSASDSVSIGKDKFRILIREISSEPAMRALEFLEQFHYKTNKSLAERDSTTNSKSATTSHGGRRAVLYAEIQIGERWLPAGYIDLQMPLMMCKRAMIYSTISFDHPVRSIQWERWDQHAMKNYLNTIVRIGRIVVSPELRGLGITRRIISAAKTFASERWHIGGMRPILWKFLLKCCVISILYLHQASSTSGKQKVTSLGVIKDMEQMTRSPSGEFWDDEPTTKVFPNVEGLLQYDSD